MQSYSLSWEEGLNGPTGILCSVPPGPPPPCNAGDVNQPLTLATGPNVKTLPVTFASLLGETPAPQACAFTINLDVECKHTNGSGHITGYDVHREAAVAISIV